MNILYFGTPDFAVPPIHAIQKSKHKIVCVVTTPDAPSGRGLKMRISAVKAAALEYNLPVLQPENLSDPDFQKQCKTYDPDIGIVVAFKKLPQSIWGIPEKGTFNLHASLLPQYRGAAPINRAIMNGEKESGLTTFFINDGIDTGNIINTVSIPIHHDDDFESLYNHMSESGAQLIIKTLDDIEKGTYSIRPQHELIAEYQIDTLKKAPKIFKDDCVIDWNKPAEEIRNQIRGLSPVPGAFSIILHEDVQPFIVKIFRANVCENRFHLSPGTVLFTKNRMFAGTGNKQCLQIEYLQPESKPKMSAESFINGLKVHDGWSFQNEK